MRVLVAQQLWKTSPVFHCLNADFYLQWRHFIHSSSRHCSSEWKPQHAAAAHAQGVTAFVLESLEPKRPTLLLEAEGESFCLQEAEHRGSRPAKRVNMSLNLSVWDVSGTTCILKLNTCFTRSGQMVLHAQKWHLQGHIGNVWWSQELKPDLPSANLVP